MALNLLSRLSHVTKIICTFVYDLNITVIMLEHYEASVVLFKIRQVCLQSAPTKQILATPLPELMEQMIASIPYLESLEWLVNKFWDGPARDAPIDGTPLVDPDGKLWTREAFGDELSDTEYRLAERLYLLAEWASQLLYHQDYDLSLVMEGYEPQFDETEFVCENDKLRQWVKETPLRRLAALTTDLLYQHAIEKAMSENQPIQDYLAQKHHDIEPDWQESAQCDEYTKRIWDALDEVHAHCAEAHRLGLTTEEQHVADMVWGWVPHDFDADLVKASREICKVATQLLPPQTELRNKPSEIVYVSKMLPEIQRICTDCSVYFDLDDSYSLPRGYLTWWLRDKYWDGREMMP